MKAKNQFLTTVIRFLKTVSPENKTRLYRNKTYHKREIAQKSGEMTSISLETMSMTREIKKISLVFFSLFYPKTSFSTISITN
jgi:hypothetical protein